jgi:hypothetical protein
MPASDATATMADASAAIEASRQSAAKKRETRIRSAGMASCDAMAVLGRSDAAKRRFAAAFLLRADPACRTILFRARFHKTAAFSDAYRFFRKERPMASPEETDYLVVGAGATAMAFVDTLISESGATVTMVDRRHRAGGHWNDAYSFVGLHQPAASYGVASRELADGVKDETGPNAGYYSLSSGPEVLAYFDAVMRKRFLPSGRVRFLGMHDFLGRSEGVAEVVSVTSGEKRAIRARKFVDATHARTEIPSTHPPKYDVAREIALVPVNGLPSLERAHANYTVVGSGKTGMDACLWLLENGAPPERIRWIVPQDAWWLDRESFQPGAEFFDRSIGAICEQFDCIAEATSIADLFRRLEAACLLHRLDPTVEPTRYRCAVVSAGEREQLRRISNVVRLGHVRAILPDRLVMEKGELPSDPDTLYVDCSAGAIQPPPPHIPVFDGDAINLVMLRICQPTFSGALIGFVEARVPEPAEKNALCDPVPSPERPLDWLRMWGATLRNTVRWTAHPEVRAWMAGCRLNSVTGFLRGVDPNDAAKMQMLQSMREKARLAAQKIPTLLSSAA